MEDTSEVTVETLISKGKRGAASYLQSLDHPGVLLYKLLDFVLNPLKPIDIWDTIDWCRWLIAGGMEYEEFANRVRSFNNPSLCGLVWTANFVAYRCRTCGISPCMSLCADCFRLGNHEGHDFNMFRSQAGGACDCGDATVMQKSGFCSRHGQHQMRESDVTPDTAVAGCELNCDKECIQDNSACQNQSRDDSDTGSDVYAGDNGPPLGDGPPLELMRMTFYVMPRLIRRLLQHLRESFSAGGVCGSNNSPTRNPADRLLQVNRADMFIDMLQDLSALGAPMRDLMIQCFTQPRFYQRFKRRRDENYELAILCLKNWDCASESEVRAFKSTLTHETLLEEFVFWMVKYEFPQKLTCLLLSMLPKHCYKEAFIRTFIDHYPRIALLLTKCSDSESLSNRVVHVSVQLFSNGPLTLYMAYERHLLYVMVASLQAMLRQILQQSTLQNPDRNLHYVVNCAHSITRQHCYWPLVSDLNNVLTHRAVVFKFLADAPLLDVWFGLLSNLQGMNVHHRETERHVGFEPSTYYAAFSAELEASATPMWSFLLQLDTPDTLHFSVAVLQRCVTALEDFFDAIGFCEGDQPAPDQVTFHLPLQRYLAAFAHNAVVSLQACPVRELLTRAAMDEPRFLMCAMAHPLRTIIAFYEILMTNMWVRNGLQMKAQAMTYVQSHFCNSMVDPDIFLLQLCAARLDSNWYMTAIVDRFRVGRILTLLGNRNASRTAAASTDELDTNGSPGTGTSVDSGLADEKLVAMLQALLTFLATLVSVRTMLGGNENDCTRDEMVSLLCMSDRTHSQLVDLLPEKSGQYAVNMARLQRHVTAVADYKAPNIEMDGHMQQGTYAPKPHVWLNLFDPIHTLLRSVHRKDYQAALDRFGAHVGIKICWPPYRIPSPVHERFEDPRKILFCPSFFSLVFTVLHKAIAGNESEINEQILSLAVFLFEVTVEYHDRRKCLRCAPFDGALIDDNETFEVEEVSYSAGQLAHCFGTECPIAAGLTVVKSVELSSSTETSDTWASVGLRGTSSSMELDVVAAADGSNSSSSNINHSAGSSNSTGGTAAVSSRLSVLRLPEVSSSSSSTLATRGGNASGEGTSPVLSSTDIEPYAPSSCTVADSAVATVSGVNTGASNASLLFSSSSSSGSSPGGGSGNAVSSEGAQQRPADIEARLLLLQQRPNADSTPAAASNQQQQSENADIVSASAVSPPASFGGNMLSTRWPTGEAPNDESNAEYALLLRHPGEIVPRSLHVRSATCAMETDDADHELDLEEDVTMASLPAQRQLVTVNESIVSLLLKLYYKFALASRNSAGRSTDGCGRHQSLIYRTPQEQGQQSVPTSRVGDGVHFIGVVLDRFCLVDASAETRVRGLRDALWPSEAASGLRVAAVAGDGVAPVVNVADGGLEQLQRDERRRRAKERQQKLVQEFANRQKSFMKKCSELLDGDPGLNSAAATVVSSASSAGSAAASAAGLIKGSNLNDDDVSTGNGDLKCAAEYECVICSQTSASTPDRPVAMVVLVQASSVLGHAHSVNEEILRVPCTEAEVFPHVLPRRSTRASYSRQRFDELTRYFDSSSWYRSANIGWEGGVHVQTCGHYLHVDCHKSYMLSQRSQPQDTPRAQQTLAPDRGEYLCPLCRQLANSVLPIHPNMGEHQPVAVGSSQTRTHDQVARELAALMAGVPTPSTSILKEMSSFMEDLTNATYVLYRTVVYFRTTHPLSLFLCSVARTNLEIDLLLHGGRLVSSRAESDGDIRSGVGSSRSKASTTRLSNSSGAAANTASAQSLQKNCFVPLFHVLALHLKALTETPLSPLWRSLTGLVDETSTSLSPVSASSSKQVPFLIRDISAVLIELLLTLPLNLDKVYFTCVVRTLYSLAATQGICRAVAKIPHRERLKLRARFSIGSDAVQYNSSDKDICELIGVIIDAFEGFSKHAFGDDDGHGLGDLTFESYIECSLMPFLRIAALFQLQLYAEQIPSSAVEEEEFAVLSRFLGLYAAQPLQDFNSVFDSSCDSPERSSTAAVPCSCLPEVLRQMHWACDQPARLVASWCSEFGEFVETDGAAARFLLVDQPLAWRQPYLLRLPHNYSVLFEFYHKRICHVCQNVPQDPSICLFCGTMLCLRENCCRQEETSNLEAVQHSLKCGAGTAVLLAVNSTSIIIIRGKRACLWGSVYLDSFGEEDRDLKRGKPLYLSEDRYALLQHQWLSHSFDHCAHKRWVWHKDNL